MATEPSPEDVRRASKERLLPQSGEAEKAMIGSILCDSKAVLPKFLQYGGCAEWFFTPAHTMILAELLVLDNGKKLGLEEYPGAGTGGDFIILTQHLRDRNILEECGGAGYITELYTFMPTAGNWPRYAAILKEKYVLREIIRGHTQGIAAAHEAQDDVEGSVKFTQQFTARVSEIWRPRFARKTNAQHLSEVLGAFDRRDRETIFGQSTGLKDIDAEIGGLMPTDLLLISGGTSSGKSALAGQFEVHHLRDRKTRVLDFTFEMVARQKLTRMLQLMSGWNLRERFEYQPELGESATPREDMENAAMELGAMPIEFFDDKTTHGSIGSIAAECRRQHAQEPLGMVVIDFDALIRGERQKGDSHEQELASIAYGAKGIATELRCVVILLSQVTVDNHGNVKTRGSDAKLFAANTALHIDLCDEDNRRLIHIWKNREGKRGKKITLGFAGQTGCFYRVDDEAEPKSPAAKKTPPRKK